MEVGVVTTCRLTLYSEVISIVLLLVGTGVLSLVGVVNLREPHPSIVRRDRGIVLEPLHLLLCHLQRTGQQCGRPLQHSDKLIHLQS